MEAAAETAPERAARLGHPPTCPACGDDRARPLYVVGGYTYAACTGCGTARLDPLPCEGEVLSLFDEAYFTGRRPGGYDDYVADDALHRLNARRRLDWIELARPRRGALLDVGCAAGHVLEEARRRGWEAQGVEPCAAMANRARRAGAVAVHADLGEAARLHPGSFDAVTMFGLIEHLRNPDRALTSAARALRPGGLVCIEAWDRAALLPRLLGRHWPLLTPPSVVWAFDRASLRRLLERAGFAVTRTDAARKQVSVHFVASVLRAPERASALRALGRAAGRVAPRGASVRYRLGDLVWVQAQRA